MNALDPNTVLTMSSQEIATLTGKQHGHVMRDIRAMLAELYPNQEDGDASKFGGVYLGGNGEERPCFHLPKRETLVLISGYSIKMRAAIIDRWQELEAQQKPSINFSDPAAAARAWADEYEARLKAERTKAEIGSRREATAMATASVATRKAEQLAVELDVSKQYCSIKRMQMLHHGQSFNWRLLKSTSIEMGLPPKEVFDANYGTVKAYHVDVWREAYAVSIDGPN